MRGGVKLALSFLGVATIYVGLLSYGVITSYYAGYLGEFGVRIENISFWPSLYDFMVQVFPVIVALIIIFLITAILLFITNYVLKFIAQKVGTSRKLRWIRSCAEMGIMSKAYMITWLLVCLVILSFKVVLSDSYAKGVAAAKKQDVFTALKSEEARTTSLIIYQNNNVAIVKDYNEQSGEFSSGYRLTNLLDKNLETKKIR